MSEPTHQPLIHRQSVHQQVRDALLEQPWLSADIEPRNQRSVATGDYTSHMLSRADMITRTALDPVFNADISLGADEYQRQVGKLLDSPSQQQTVRDALKIRMFGSPFKPHHGIHHTGDAMGVLNEHLAHSIGRTPAGPALPEADILLTADALNDRIHAFFAGREELAFAKSASYPMAAASSSVTLDARADALTAVAMEVLGREAKSAHAFKIRLATMAKPESELANALTGFLNGKAGEYPSELYDTKQGQPVADTLGQRYAEELCAQLRTWMKTSHVTVAKADPQAPGTKALEAALAKQSPAKGQSAA